MKKQGKGFIAGVVLTVLVMGLIGTALATTGSQTVEVGYNDIKVTLNGEAVNLVDANGAPVEPFAINGTTYLPVRAVASALGLDVGWDQATTTVVLSSQGQATATPSPAPVPGGTVDYQITHQDCRLYSSAFDDDTYYSALVEIENTGTAAIYLKDAKFNFEDAAGHLLETESFVSADPDVILPGEKGYFYADGILDIVKAEDNYIFKPSIKVAASKLSAVPYTVTDTAMTVDQEDKSVTITGRVTNSTSEEAGLIWVCCVLFDANGTPLAAGGTNLFDVSAGATESFSRDFSSFDLGDKASQVASFKVFSFKTQYQF